jgi:hypothetical protein
MADKNVGPTGAKRHRGRSLQQFRQARRLPYGYRAPTSCFFLSAMMSSWTLAGTFL